MNYLKHQSTDFCKRSNENEREDFLSEACCNDENLRYEVESLLAVETEEDFLQSGAFEIGMKVLSGENEMSSEEPTLRFETKFADEKTIDNRYVILEGLDAGGMGEVFKAKDLKFNPPRLVVIKVLKRESKSHPWKFKKFRDEGDAQSRVQHENVAMVFDRGTLPSGEPYLVVELINGQNLGQIITAHQAENNQMDFHFVAEIMRQICAGVSAIHRANLIHRDLKPKNIMVFETSETDDVAVRVKIIDFGIVRDLDKSTVFGQSVGTLPFMSPEQVNGDEVTKASDIYSLGVIAYQMLTNNLPFNAKTHTQLYVLQMEGVKVMPSALCHALPQEAERVILKALSFNPNERQKSAREFGEELKRALTEKKQPPTPQPSQSEATTRPMPKPSRFNKVLIASAVVLLISLLVGALWLWNPFGARLTRVQVVTTALESDKPNADNIVYDKEPSYPTGQPPQGMNYATVGFTVWRTRPADAVRDGDDTARDTIEVNDSSGNKKEDVSAERIDDYIANGQKLYLGIESLTENFLPDKGGYLYVISREQYADGTFGKAWLLFPNASAFNGNNLIKTEQPIVLPHRKGKVYQINRSPNQVAETYTIIISPWKFWLPKKLGEGRTELPPDLFADWERQFSERAYRASLRGGVGKPRTKREQKIGTRETIEADEPLTQNDPFPQTVLRTVVRKGSPAMVTVTLRLRN